MTGDYIPPKVPLYLTPDNVPVGRFCRQLSIPDDPVWVGLVDGVLSRLMDANAWRAYGELTPEEAAENWAAMIYEAWALESCGVTAVPTPFWDESSDLEDEEPADVQEWYGYVTDPEAPGDELTFVEDASIWIMTGFIAYSGAIGAALFFRTIAKNWVLAWRRGDLGEVIRVIIDGAEYGRVDTSSASVGDLVKMPIVAGDGAHDITLIKVG